MSGVKRLTPKWLTQFKTHKQWFRSLKVRRGSPISATLKNTYNSSMKRFIEFLESSGDKHWNPDLIISWAKERIQSGEFTELNEIFVDFSEWLQGHEVEGYHKRILKGNQRYMGKNSAYSKAHGSVRGFFVHNYIPLAKSPKDKSSTKSKKNDRKYAVFKTDKTTGRDYRDLGDLNKFLSRLSFRDKTFALLLLSSSQDIGDILTLTIGFVEEQADKERLFWEGKRLKNGEDFRTFFSKEATSYLRKYITQYRVGSKSEDPIFYSEPRTYEGRFIEGHALKPRAISENFAQASRSLGYANGDTQHPFRPKRFRHLFSTACLNSNFKRDRSIVTKTFMGHKFTVNQSYAELNDSILESEYARLEPLLTIESEDNRAELEKVKKDATNALGISLKLEAENRELKTTVDELKYMVTSLKNDLDVMQNDAEATEAERNSPEAIHALNNSVDKNDVPIERETQNMLIERMRAMIEAYDKEKA